MNIDILLSMEGEGIINVVDHTSEVFIIETICDVNTIIFRSGVISNYITR